MTESSDPCKKQESEIGGSSCLKRYCLECGSDVEPGADFCYRCGSRRIVDVDPENRRVVQERGHCPFCGYDNIPEAKFCASCGQRLGEFEYSGPHRRMKGVELLAIILAAVPGAVNLCGLGHVVLKMYSRAFAYLCISAVLIYIRYFSGNLTTSTVLFIEIIGIGVYLKQTLEVMNEVFRRQQGGR